MRPEKRLHGFFEYENCNYSTDILSKVEDKNSSLIAPCHKTDDGSKTSSVGKPFMEHPGIFWVRLESNNPMRRLSPGDECKDEQHDKTNDKPTGESVDQTTDSIAYRQGNKKNNRRFHQGRPSRPDHQDLLQKYHKNSSLFLLLFCLFRKSGKLLSLGDDGNHQ